MPDAAALLGGVDPKTAAEIATAACGIGVFLFGILQYRRSQTWKESEFAARLLSSFARDPDLAFCRVLMDWSPRLVEAPRRYFAILDAQEEPRMFNHSWEKLGRALTKEKNFDWQEVIYRDSFDAFFTYLQQLDRCLRIKLVSHEDLAGLEYWIEKVASLETEVDHAPVFRAFVEKYYSSALNSLMQRYNVTWSKKSGPDQPHSV